MEGKPLEVMELLHEVLTKIDRGAILSKSSWRITFTSIMQAPEIEDEPSNEAGTEETKEETKEEKKAEPTLQRGARALI